MIDMKVPSPGESITEVQIARWLKKDGEYVEKDEELCEIDSDKATLTLNAEASGVLHIKVKEGETIAVGKVVCTIDEAAEQPKSKPAESKKAVASAKEEVKAAPAVTSEKVAPGKSVSEPAKKVGTGGRISKDEELRRISNLPAAAGGDGNAMPAEASKSVPGSRNERREKMSMLRKKVSQRLVAVKQETAMLTTFNEVDMSAVMDLRRQYKDKFSEKYGVNLGFMSFFTKAVCMALKNFPAVNAMIENDEIVYHDYCDIGIAVSAPKGLMVPVIRNAESLSLAEIEKQVAELAGKAREGKISIEEMAGGTFTITNGGVFGSMLSTPIINPPQSAILGMHNIIERPVVHQGRIMARPIMYVALSYDHRIIDGRESVSFLVNVKQMLEEPVRMLVDGKDPDKQLLGL